MYGINNPVVFVDSNGNWVFPIAFMPQVSQNVFTYDRDAAVGYSQTYYENYNSDYPVFDNDCTNFVSQSLHAGGLPTDDQWKTYWGVSRDSLWKHKATAAWDNASAHYKYFSNPENGYVDYVITVSSSYMVQEVANSGTVQYGDILYWSNGGTESIYHAAIIAGIQNGEIYYAAHTDNYAWKALGQGFFKQQENESPGNINNVYIIHLNSGGPRS